MRQGFGPAVPTGIGMAVPGGLASDATSRCRTGAPPATGRACR